MQRAAADKHDRDRKKKCLAGELDEFVDEDDERFMQEYRRVSPLFALGIEERAGTCYCIVSTAVSWVLYLAGSYIDRHATHDRQACHT